MICYINNSIANGGYLAYDPKTNNGIDWHDLTAKEKIDFLIAENTWLAGVAAAEMGKATTHEQNLKTARKYVGEHYPDLWEMVYGNCAVNKANWPEQNALRTMIHRG